MAREVKEVEIAGNRYRITQLGGIDGMLTALQVARQLAPVLATFELKLERKPGQGWVDSLLAADVADVTAVLKSAGALLERLDADELLSLVKTFGKVTEVRVAAGGKSREVRWPPLVSERDDTTVLDEHFAGRLPDLLQWLVTCLGFCCGRFLGGSANTKPSGKPTQDPAEASE